MSGVSSKKKKVPTVSFRAYEASDLPKVKKLHSGLFPVRYQDDFYEGLLQKHKVALVGVSQSEADGIVAVATARKIAPRLELSRLSDWWYSIDSHHHVYLMTFGVATDYRNHGIGASILQKLIVALKEDGMTCLTLHVKQGNTSALRFYQKQGFSIIKRLPDFYMIDGKSYDSFWMKFDVNDPSPKLPPDVLSVISTDYNSESVHAYFVVIILVVVLVVLYLSGLMSVKG